MVAQLGGGMDGGEKIQTHPKQKTVLCFAKKKNGNEKTETVTATKRRTGQCKQRSSPDKQDRPSTSTIVANLDCQASGIRRQRNAYEAVPRIRADGSAVDIHRYTRMRM